MSESSIDKHSSSRPASLDAKIRTRVVREHRRETWFVVNEDDTRLSEIPLPIEPGSSLSRAEVNGEYADFRVLDEHGIAIVTPYRALRPGAGTIIVLRYE